MEKESTDFVPLLEDIETPVATADSIHDPIKPRRNHSKKCKKARCIKRCLLVVLKVVFVLFLLFATVASIAGYRGYKWMSREVQKWTVTEPNDLPPANFVPTVELDSLKASAKLFWDSIQAGVVPNDFILTAVDLNGIIATSDFLRGNAFTEMKTNEFKTSVSLPTDGIPGGKGRYFVATETITWDPELNQISLKIDEESNGRMIEAVLELTTLDDGKTLNLQVLKGRAFEHDIPQDFIDEHYNLLEDLYECRCNDRDCKQTRKFLEGLAGVSMEDRQIVVHPDPNPVESTYYKEHEGHTWHHHGHHHRHGNHHGRHHKGEHGEDHGDHHRALRATYVKSTGHRWRKLRMLRKLFA